ncbi:DUF5797 family protein [Halomarina litorea]|uniref:DUF5797 family protein n=1 Tax=Halomarina litorea TaxID=2961595 RepID=UPI0020C48B95|nr:DUF5797 family protein [Halomarina sp. BCD28]
MTLSEEAKGRLKDIVELQPTKNKELQQRWEMESGSEVHQYLESELKEYYFRDENSLIRATQDAAGVVGIEMDPEVVKVPPLQVRITEVLAGPDEDSESVVSVLHKLRDAGVESDTDSVRSGLRRLEDKGLVDVVQKTVPTFRLAVEREDLNVEALDEEPADEAGAED